MPLSRLAAAASEATWEGLHPQRQKRLPSVVRSTSYTALCSQSCHGPCSGPATPPAMGECA